MKLHKHKNTPLNAEDKFCHDREVSTSPENLTQLGELAIKLLNDKNLEASRVRPFFWSLVETYIDRFKLYPFDVNKAVFSYLELNDYPQDTMRELVKRLESQFEKSHGRPLRNATQSVCQSGVLDKEIKELRDSLRYAAMVAENSGQK